MPSKYSIDEDSNSEGGVQSPPDCNLLLAPPTPPASHAHFESPSHTHLLQNNDVIKSESHDNIFSTKPKSVHSSELKRRASDVGVVAPPSIGSSPPPLLSNSSSSSSNHSTSVSSNNNNSSLQVNLCQKLLFLHQLTHNMTTDCSLNYKLDT